MIEWNTAIEIGLEHIDYISLDEVKVKFNTTRSFNVELTLDDTDRVQYHATITVDDKSGHLLSIFYEYGIGKISYPDISDFFNAMTDKFIK